MGEVIAQQSTTSGIDLYWIPLGAGGTGFVRLNGRIYELIRARLEGRRPLALYHTALQVHLPEGRFVVETMWPSPDGDVTSRGVVLEGAVGSRLLGRWRTFRYEVRRWHEGCLPDAGDAIGGPQRVSDDPETTRRLLDSMGSLPHLVWGRDECGIGDMWNSNSVIAWLLTQAGLPMGSIRPPSGGRAPGWNAGVEIGATRPDPAFGASGLPRHRRGAC